MAVNEVLGLGYDFSSNYPEKINAVTKQDVLSVARKYLTLDSYVISIVGPGGGQE
jgi:predicted Zn-dependent peptidase